VPVHILLPDELLSYDERRHRESVSGGFVFLVVEAAPLKPGPWFNFQQLIVRKEYPMRTMLCLAAIVAAAAIVPAAAIAADANSDANSGWVQLFNGKDLTGWVPKIKGFAAGENFGDTFRVEDGLLKVCYDKYDGKFNNRFGHLFYKQPLSGNYLLRVEYRFVGDQLPDAAGWATRNNGIMIFGQSPESMGKDQNFPVSIEVQLLGGLGKGPRSTANLCTPGTNVVYEGKLFTPHVLNSKSKTYDGDQWVTVEVEVKGNRVRHIVEGQTVLEYTDPQLDPKDGDAKKLLAAGADKMLTGGTISIQSESHPCQFRKIEMKKLPD